MRCSPATVAACGVLALVGCAWASILTVDHVAFYESPAGYGIYVSPYAEDPFSPIFFLPLVVVALVVQLALLGSTTCGAYGGACSSRCAWMELRPQWWARVGRRAVPVLLLGWAALFSLSVREAVQVAEKDGRELSMHTAFAVIVLLNVVCCAALVSILLALHRGGYSLFAIQSFDRQAELGHVPGVPSPETIGAGRAADAARRRASSMETELRSMPRRDPSQESVYHRKKKADHSAHELRYASLNRSAESMREHGRGGDGSGGNGAQEERDAMADSDTLSFGTTGDAVGLNDVFDDGDGDSTFMQAPSELGLDETGQVGMGIDEDEDEDVLQRQEALSAKLRARYGGGSMNYQRMACHLNCITFIALVAFVTLFMVGLDTTCHDLTLSELDVEPGFEVTRFASVKGARSLLLFESSSSGKHVVLVGSRGSSVFAVDATDGSKVRVVAEGLDQPNGIAVVNDSLLVATATSLLRFEGLSDFVDNESAGPLTAPALVYDFPSQKRHSWKYAVLHPDGDSVLASVGANCDICEPNKTPLTGTILRVFLNQTGLATVYAQGLRNAVGMDFDSGTGTLWLTENGEDWLGERFPPDELNTVAAGSALPVDFGFPYCVADDTPHPLLNGNRDCSSAQFASPVHHFAAHAVALGAKFYPSSGLGAGAFPAEFHGQLFVSEAGSRDRRFPVGPRVARLTLNAARDRIIRDETFLGGFRQTLLGRAYCGRPIDVEVIPDGSLLISSEWSDEILRVAHVR